MKFRTLSLRCKESHKMWKLSFFKRIQPQKGLLFFFFLQLSFCLTAQTTIWSEDFNSYANGVIAGNGTGTSTAAWTSVAGASVNGGRLIAVDTDAFGSSLANPLVWSTALIDISTFTNVTVSLNVDAFDVPALDPTDNFTLQYRIDGGAWQTIENASGNAADPIDSAYTWPVASATNLEIRALFHNTWTNENYTLDNILVTGDYCQCQSVRHRWRWFG